MKKYITKQSNIKGAGKGLFTNASFKKGEVIGLAHVDDQPASEIGRNHNHNEKNPTAYSKKIDNKRYIYASKDLKPGEEITTNYRLQPELEQPEDFMRKGGSVLKMPNKKNSKGYSRSLSATNKLFTQNFLFAKPKSRKNKVFDPNSKYYAEGGEPCDTGEYWNGKNCVPKEKDSSPIMQNPSWQQEPVVNPAAYVSGYRGGNPKMYKYGFIDSDQGNIVGGGGFGFPKPGVHLSALGVVPTSSNDKQYFKGAYEASISKDIKNLNLGLGVNTAITGYPGENGFVRDPIKFQPKLNLKYNFEEGGALLDDYIEVDLNEDEIEEYRRGGYIVEEIDTFQKGGISKVSSNSSDNTRVNYQKPLVKSFNRSNNLESFYKKEREKDLQKQKDATAYHDKTQKVKQNQSFGEFINQDVLGIPTLEEQTKQVTNDKKLLKKELKPYFETEKEIDQFISQQYSRPIASSENNWNDGPIQMVYPEKYFIGPSGGMIGNIKNLGKNTFNLGKKVLSNPYVSGGLNAYFGYHGINEFSDPNSLTRKSMSRAYDNPTGSNIGDAAFDVGINSLNFVGLPFNKAIKGSKNLINNTYKINPWAFKPNPEAYYRGIGEAGYKDAIESGVLRTNRNPNWTSSPGDSPYFFNGKNFKGIKQYEPNVIAEVTNQPMRARTFSRFAGKGDESVFQPIINTGQKFAGMDVVKKLPNIPLGENIKFYKKHWRKGYKEIPKQLPGSPNVDFSKYLTQEEAIAARAERLISQKNKPGWNEQLTPELEQRLSTAVERHNPASDYPGEKLGSNTMGRTATEVSKDANLSGIPLNEANKARIAAHETGHYYSNSSAEGAEWLKPFNLNKLESYKTKTYLRGKNRSANYANEIRERAAQLKDYIAQKNGIPLNQDFKITQVQLDDAIKNYVKDTGLDNTMSKMLGALNDKKGLLKTMNKYALGTVPVIIGAETLQQKKQGGTSNDYVDVDLTPEEIKDLIAQGYVIEELN